MVSVIVPIYNGEKYIKKCVYSIIKNILFDEYEIILINDGSTDKSEKICSQITKENKKVQLYSQKNAGVSAARMLGLEKSTGKWIMFVDVDDQIINKIELPNDEKVDFLIYSNKFEAYKEYIVKENEKELLTGLLNADSKNIFCRSHINTVWSKIYKRDIIINNNISFDKSVFHGEDMLFNLDYINKCKIILTVPQSIYLLCGNSTSATHKYQRNIIENDINFFKHLDKYSIKVTPKFADLYYNCVLNSIWIIINQKISHEENKVNLFARRKELSNLLKISPYKEALNNYTYLIKNKLKKIFYILLKVKAYYVVLIITKLLNSKKDKANYSVKEI